jgi:polysaccharide export outer membrane protein
MRPSGGQAVRVVLAICCVATALTAGCQCAAPICVDQPVPRELAKVSLPPYVIETPDILLIDAVRVIPLPPYHIEPLDALLIQAANALPTAPISGVYPVDSDGTVNLGQTYGSVRVVDLTVEQARAAIEKYLKTTIKDPQVSVSLAQSRGMQQVRGEHLVRPDGTVGLGVYGAVYVAGMTLLEAKAAIEAHLSQFLYKPEVSVDVFAYNSKVYYVITDGAGFGEQVIRVPATGNETVLDAVSQINGLPPVAAKNRIWIARPAPAGNCPDQVLPVDWKGITRGAQTATNYQVLPGDRIYVMAQPIITTDTYLARFISPIERALGITLLGSTTVHSVNGKNLNGNGGF